MTPAEGPAVAVSFNEARFPSPAVLFPADKKTFTFSAQTGVSALKSWEKKLD